MASFAEHFDVVWTILTGVLTILLAVLAYLGKLGISALSRIDENQRQLSITLLDHEKRISHVEGRLYNG